MGTEVPTTCVGDSCEARVTLAPVAANGKSDDEDPFIQFGLDAWAFDIIVLRSKTHFRAAYEKLAREILVVDTPDWGPADLRTLPYEKVRSGVFPVTA